MKKTFQFIVSGDPVEVQVHPDAPLSMARSRALEESLNFRFPEERWEIRDERGRLVPEGTRAAEAPATLHLTLPVGHDG
jgi:hypothetical protein